jgi:uncharacterized membrane protein YfcA
MLCSVHS